MFSTAFYIVLALSAVSLLLLIAVSKAQPIAAPRKVTTTVDPNTTRKQQ